MSNIPTKADLANDKANATAAAAANAVETDVKFYTDAIIEAMRKGDKYWSDNIRNVSPAAQARLQTAFAAQGWTLTVRNMRTGCTISWT